MLATRRVLRVLNGRLEGGEVGEGWGGSKELEVQLGGSGPRLVVRIDVSH